jgi:predicted DNA-binding transcriptional regulator AlpA
MAAVPFAPAKRVAEADQVAAVLPVEGYVRLPTILKFFPISRSAWWAGVATGRFPAAVKLGPRTTAWRAADIRELIDRADPSTGKGKEAA